MPGRDPAQLLVAFNQGTQTQLDVVTLFTHGEHFLKKPRVTGIHFKQNRVDEFGDSSHIHFVLGKQSSFIWADPDLHPCLEVLLMLFVELG